MEKPKYVDCWTYPKPVLDEKLGEIKTDVSAVTEEVETLTDSFEELSGDFEDLSDNVETISGNFAGIYDSTATYSVGDFCIYENELYKCTTAIETAEEWTPAHWTQTTVTDTFDDLSDDVETLKARKLLTWIWNASTYSGDGIAGYAYADFTLTAGIPSAQQTDWGLFSVRSVTTSDGYFIGSVRNVDYATNSITVRLFNCTAESSHPGTILCDCAFVLKSVIAFSGDFE